MTRRLFRWLDRRCGRVAAGVVQRVWRKGIGKSTNRRMGVICRFYPTCSHYSVVAFLRHGLIAGGLMTYRRVRRCNPKNTDSCIDFPT
ncbi:MAG TPA: hypothetical protein DDZ51_18590 [Planctomycetaceae bacterium]|nr:hypothetical protein [Planctomycetaceae bacterium]